MRVHVADHPLITYDVGYTGRSHIDEAFEVAGVAPDIVLTAMQRINADAAAQEPPVARLPLLLRLPLDAGVLTGLLTAVLLGGSGLAGDVCVHGLKLPFRRDRITPTLSTETTRLIAGCCEPAGTTA